MIVEIRRHYKNKAIPDSVAIHNGLKVNVTEDDTHWYVTYEDGNRTRWIPKNSRWTVSIL